jgi:hypothetical protein
MLSGYSIALHVLSVEEMINKIRIGSVRLFMTLSQKLVLRNVEWNMALWTMTLQGSEIWKDEHRVWQVHSSATVVRDLHNSQRHFHHLITNYFSNHTKTFCDSVKVCDDWSKTSQLFWTLYNVWCMFYMNDVSGIVYISVFRFLVVLILTEHMV